MTGFLVYLCSLVAAVAVFYMVVGNKVFFQSRSVRYKDQRIETGETKKSSQDVFVSLAGAVICAGVAYAVTGTWYYTLAGLSGGCFALKWRQAKQENDRRELLRSQFADVLGQFESAAFGGLNPYQAVEDAVPDMPRPARDVFYEILRRTRAGDTLAQAIEVVRKQTGWNDLKILSVGMTLYNRVGCDLGTICRHALEVAEEKERARGVIAAAIAQSAMTIKVLTALPFIILGALRTMSPAFAEPLFHTMEGNIVFMFSISWVILGNIVTKRMISSVLAKGG